jgi:hypothetical protein
MLPHWVMRLCCSASKCLMHDGGCVSPSFSYICCLRASTMHVGLHAQLCVLVACPVVSSLGCLICADVLNRLSSMSCVAFTVFDLPGALASVNRSCVLVDPCIAASWHSCLAVLSISARRGGMEASCQQASSNPLPSFSGLSHQRAMYGRQATASNSSSRPDLLA